VSKKVIKTEQSVALTGSNRTGPSYRVGRPTTDAPGSAEADRPRARPARCRQRYRRRRRQRAKQYWPIRQTSNNKKVEYGMPECTQIICNKRLRYRRETAWRAMSVEILSTTV